MEDVKVTQERFDKFARRTENEIRKVLPGIVEAFKKRVVAEVAREIGRRIAEQRTALYQYVDRSIDRALSTPKLKERVKQLIEAEFGRQDPNAINVEVVERLGTGAKPKRNKDASEFE
jgi:hypothetical protein